MGAVMSWWYELQQVIFAGQALPPDLRARVELLRDRAAGAAGLTLTCGGASMEPVIARGAQVVVRGGQPRRGAVAAFVTRRGGIELHRLVLAAPGLDWWVHAGDNQSSPELGLVHGAQIVGVAEVPTRAPTLLQAGRAACRLARAAGRVTIATARASSTADAGPDAPRAQPR
jgi:hypothetical protein